MTTLSRIILIYGIVAIQNYIVNSEHVKLPGVVATKTFDSADGIVGVASVAEVTSKDGKVFSSGGVKFYPSAGAKLKKNSNFMQPWTFTSKSNDGFAMGAVQIYPGTVMASATSYGNPKNEFGQINPIIHWPERNNFFPRTTFPSNIHRNQFYRNYMFKDFDPFIPDFGDMRFRPIYDPFVDIWH